MVRIQPVKSKRKNFVFASLVMGFGFWATNWLANWSQVSIFWLNGLALAFFVFLVLYFLFRQRLKSKLEFFPILILPCFLSIAFSWFAPLLSSSPARQLVLALAYTASCYLVLLTENLFIVSSQFKAVPLYRTAFATGFAFTLLVGLLLFTALFSLEFSPWINSALIGLITFFLFYHFFWSVIIADSEKENLLIFTLVSTLLVSELALVISFWYLSSILKALYLISWVYILGGVFQSKLRERLFPNILREYVLIGAVALGALLFSAGW